MPRFETLRPALAALDAAARAYADALVAATLRDKETYEETAPTHLALCRAAVDVADLLPAIAAEDKRGGL